MNSLLVENSKNYHHPKIITLNLFVHLIRIAADSMR